MDHNKQYSYKLETISDEETAPLQRVSVGQLQRLVRLLDESDVSEIEVTRAEEGMHLVLRKASLHADDAAGMYALLESDAQEVVMSSAGTSSTDFQHTITAPLVGIFHTWGKPKGGPLVTVGDRIKVGQLVGTIQSLNVINEVESGIAGRIIEILAQDGQAVEYGQPLLVVNSSEEA